MGVVSFQGIKDEAGKAPDFVDAATKAEFVANKIAFNVTGISYKEDGKFGPRWNVNIKLAAGTAYTLTFNRGGDWRLGHALMTASLKGDEVGPMYLSWVRYDSGREGFDLTYQGEEFTPGTDAGLARAAGMGQKPAEDLIPA